MLIFSTAFSTNCSTSFWHRHTHTHVLTARISLCCSHSYFWWLRFPQLEMNWNTSWSPHLDSVLSSEEILKYLQIAVISVQYLHCRFIPRRCIGPRTERAGAYWWMCMWVFNNFLQGCTFSIRTNFMQFIFVLNQGHSSECTVHDSHLMSHACLTEKASYS